MGGGEEMFGELSMGGLYHRHCIMAGTVELVMSKNNRPGGQ